MFKIGDKVRFKEERGRHYKWKIVTITSFYTDLDDREYIYWANGEERGEHYAYRFESIEKSGLAKFIELQEVLSNG